LSLAALSCATVSSQPNQKIGTLLPVHYQKQIASQFCWAAAGEIVLKYWRQQDSNAVYMTQCEQALAVYQFFHSGKGEDLPCGPDSVAGALNIPFSPFQGIIPIITNYNYTSQNGVISWEMLKGQIDSLMPVISLLGWSGVLKQTKSANGGHYIVVDGYQVSSITGQRFVSYCDPWNANKSVNKLITYEEFANPAERVFLDTDGYRFNKHILDIYHIRPRGFQK
jgi:hypothetical protein